MHGGVCVTCCYKNNISDRQTDDLQPQMTILRTGISYKLIKITVNFLNIRTSKKFVVITLKFELCGSTIEY